MKFSNPVRFLASALIVFFGLSFVSVRADDLPKFSDPKVTAFVDRYAQLVTDYLQAYKQAVSTKDLSQLVRLKSQVNDLQKDLKEVPERLSTPEEVQRFEEFIAAYTKIMVDATQPTPTPNSK
jgi:Effector-associated domain 9